MKHDSDKKSLLLDDDTVSSGITRWIPTMIVFFVVAGFFTLSWYAYHAGMESVKEEDLLVVEADKTPLKEKPTDPGGMQFPNQDKTVFDTFTEKKGTPQKVERILPSPEEPIDPKAESEETKTWINKDSQSTIVTDPRDKQEQVLSKVEKTQDAAPMVEKPVSVNDAAAEDTETFIATSKQEKAPKNKQDAEVASQKQGEPKNEKPKQNEKEDYFAAPKESQEPVKVIESAVKAEPATEAPATKVAAASTTASVVTAQQPAVPEKSAAAQKASDAIRQIDEAAGIAPVEKTKKAEAADPAKPAKAERGNKPDSRAATSAKASSGSAAVQLGAYRSEEEAEAAWDKMHLKYKELSDKQPMIVRADLGSRGIYYRLRVGGLEDAAAAKELCSALSARGQACILPAK